VVRYAVLERLADGMLDNPELERLLAAALDSPAAERFLMRVLESKLLDEAVHRLLEGEELWLVVNAYFAVFWSTTGQTPGNRLMHIRVCDGDDGTVLSPRRSLLRFGALLLAALPLLAGFLTVLVDDRRRGLHDMLAGTVVVGVPLGDRLGLDRVELGLGDRAAVE